MLDKLTRDFRDILDEGKLWISSLLESAGKTGLPIFNGKVNANFCFGMLCLHSLRLYRISQHLSDPDNLNIGTTLTKTTMNMCCFSGKEDGG